MRRCSQMTGAGGGGAGIWPGTGFRLNAVSVLSNGFIQGT